MKTTLEQIKYQVGDRVRIIDRTAVLHDCTGVVVNVNNPMVLVRIDTGDKQAPEIHYWPPELMLVEAQPNAD